MIRAWSEELGFGHTPPAVYGRDDARAVLREAARDLGLAVATEHASGDRRDPWAISLPQLDHALERYRLRYAPEDNTSTVDDSEIDVLEAAVLADLTLAYERRLNEYAAVDYLGMLTLPLHLLEANSRALHMLQDAYRWILVDEYQDCCRLQASLLQQLTSRHQNLTVVGDPFQSIYRFRGADPRLLVESSGPAVKCASRFTINLEAWTSYSPRWLPHHHSDAASFAGTGACIEVRSISMSGRICTQYQKSRRSCYKLY